MGIAEALRESAGIAGWSFAKLASEADTTETTARRWMSGYSMPPGDKLMLLRHRLPGLAERLDRTAVA